MKDSGLALTCLLLGVLATSAAAVTIETVTVGNPNNLRDPRYSTGVNFGIVSYTYQIGKYEITTSQYAAFLNAVARTDAYGLYNPGMDTGVDPLGCNIQRTGEAGAYSYSVAPDWANRPVNFVSWGDAVRFANWMHNGQPTTGIQDNTTTEDGSYLLDGAMTEDALRTVTRQLNATWVIPTQNEWYKAAYHKNDGLTGNYWAFPTASNVAPDNALGVPTDPGNTATIRSGTDTYTISTPYWRTEVGEHENSASAYGTFDQGGNVAEWNERLGMSIIGWARGVSGGSYLDWASSLNALNTSYGSQTTERTQFGFRLALVPEPGTLLLFALAAGAMRLKRSCKL